MRITNASRVLLLPATTIAAVLLLTSCLRVSKGEVNSGIRKGLDVGAHRSEVIRHLDVLKVNGVKPVVSGYERETGGRTVLAPGGKEVEVEGKVTATFSNGIGGHLYLCNEVFVFFYFDKSDKLITWITDC